ncbi:MAG: hypothetical protein MI924_21835 [Chloroflexales bacterium]|nr:hypothetical protein [Chloroflexales bacterium]
MEPDERANLLHFRNEQPDLSRGSPTHTEGSAGVMPALRVRSAVSPGKVIRTHCTSRATHFALIVSATRWELTKARYGDAIHDADSWATKL